MTQIHKNNFIVSAKTGFYETGLSKGSYGLTLTLANTTAIGTDELLAMKQIVEEPLPPAAKKARVMLPKEFHSTEALRWLLAALSRFGIQSQVAFWPALGETEALSLAAWRILQVDEPHELFIDFNELWYSPSEAALESTFPLWPVGHQVYLFVRGQGMAMESVVGFISRAAEPWALL
jgi:hypothetical protein